jgi:hypothetical protein
MILVPLLLISQSLAQPDLAETEAPTPTVYQQVTQIEEDAFSGLSLEGELVRPSGVLAVVVPRPSFHPLFQLRRDFAIEIQESPAALSRLGLP